jgi:hypothetical protein
MENVEESQMMVALLSAVSKCTAASGRFFAMSVKSFAGTTVSPDSSMSSGT